MEVCDETNELVFGSLDSGMDDVMRQLVIDSDEKDSRSDESDEASKVAGDKQPSNGTLFVNRGTSVSSDETMPSGPEEREMSLDGIPLTRPERVAAIMELIETYVSDNYLTRDIFLLKQFRRTKDGWISLKFMAAYKRIKRICKDLEEVRDAARNSPLVELNTAGNKLRRLTPLPESIEDYIPTRMTIIGQLPNSLRSLPALSKYLTNFGDVASIQLIRPGGNLPEIVRETAVNFPKIRSEWCALVEFNEISAAAYVTKAVNNDCDELGPGWALELVVPWLTRKNSEQSDPGRNRGIISCPSSGYS